MDSPHRFRFLNSDLRGLHRRVRDLRCDTDLFVSLHDAGGGVDVVATERRNGGLYPCLGGDTRCSYRLVGSCQLCGLLVGCSQLKYVSDSFVNVLFRFPFILGVM
jgi:hypothetical protein